MAGIPARNLDEEFEQEMPQEEPGQIPVVETPGMTGTLPANAFIPMMQLLNQVMLNAQRIQGGLPNQQRELAVSEKERELEQGEALPSQSESRMKSRSRIIVSSESEGEGSDARDEVSKTRELGNLRKKIRRLEDRLKEREALSGRPHRQTYSSHAEKDHRSGGKEESYVRGMTGMHSGEKSEPYIPHHISGRQDRQTRGNPFSRDILQDPLPSHFKPVNHEYDGTTDPEEHVSRFESVALLHQYTEGVKCRVFATTLVGLAQQWFKQLLPRSIFSFEDFYDLFIQQFASARRSAKSSLHLTTIKQRNGEPLRDYVSRFNMRVLETPGVDERIKVHAFVQGLGTGPFFDELVMKEPETFNDLLKRITPFIQLEEAKSERRNEAEKARQKNEGKVGPGGNMPSPTRPPPRFNNRPQHLKWSRTEDQRPCNAEVRGDIKLTRPMSAIMEIAQTMQGWTAPPAITGPPRGRPSPLFCKFHNQFGHDTDECHNLKMVIERLIREGKLTEFVRRDGNNQRGTQREDVGKRPAQQRPPPPPPFVQKQRIEMIMGGEGTSNRAKKAEARIARQVSSNIMEIGSNEKRPAETVEFSIKDERPMLQPHNDALVIVADIADVLISRTFVDTGSSVNILFYSCLKKMNLGERLRPPPGALYGFSGESVIPLGALDLPVTLGSPGANMKKMVEFVVLDLPDTAYNAILGRPALNSFKAIVSTYHLKMKFPTQNGTGEAWGSQTSSKECYVKAISKSNKRGAVGAPDEIKSKRDRLDIHEIKEPLEGEERKPQMEPAEETLTIELYPGREGFTTKIGAGMSEEVSKAIIECLQRNADVFAFHSKDLKGIEPSIAMHQLNEDPRIKPVKQKLRQFGAEKDEIIKEEVRKLLEAGHIIEIQFPTWLSNAVLVGKSEGKWRMCMDFRDLNKACPKDHYPLPRIDQLVDATSGCELLSMMDAYQGYHQVRMHPADICKVAFAVCIGVFGWARMSFGLKNAGATYQRMMDMIFKGLIGRNVAVYVDDILVKSLQAKDHAADLEEVFQVARAKGLKLNPTKCAFGVTSGKFLGYMVTPRGIEANQAKVEALKSMTPPRNVREVQKLNGRITALSRFISRTADKSLHFFKVLRNHGRFEWGEECQRAFEQLKEHLLALPLLSKPLPGDVLILYLAISESALSTVLLKEEKEQQKPIYFVSKVLQGPEMRYTELEKAALAVMTTARKLRPYFLSHKIIVRTTFPFLQVLGKPDISGRMVKWAVELGEYEIEFQPRSAIKAQALVDFIAETTRAPEIENWEAWVDGSVMKEKAGAGILICKPDGAKLQFAIQFGCRLSNNEAEYEAVVRAMRMLTTMGAEKVTINTDSQLVAQQILGKFEIKEQRMKEYADKVKVLAAHFQKFEVRQIPREDNEIADRLARLASSDAPAQQGEITLLTAEGKSTERGVYSLTDASDWRTGIVRYLRTGEGTEAPSRLAAKYARYFLLEDQLYRRGFNNPHLRCLSKEEGDHILKEIHAGCCGNHSGRRDLVRKTVRAGFYWPNIMEAAKKIVQTCGSCQKHAPLIHIPGEEMGAMYASCPFDKWGIDIVGKFPTAPGGRVFLIVAVDYFSKWVEAEAVAKIDDTTIQRFLWKNICCRYGIPRILVSDNGTQFTSSRIQGWCEDMGIRQRFVSVAHPQANGQVEVTNRTITEGIKKRLEGSKGKWAEELDAVLWAYRTSPRTATGEAPFTLVYGANAVVPAEVIVETYRIRKHDEEKNNEIRREELDLVDIRREHAHIQEEKYKSQVKAAYNKHVRVRRFQKGDLVLKRADAVKPVTKLEANWEGPFIVTEVVGGGAYNLSDMNGRSLTRPWNINTLKKYYV